MSKLEINAKKQDRSEIVKVLQDAGAVFKTKPNGDISRYLCCPFHQEKNASAYIKKSNETGSWSFTCKVCSDKQGMDVVSLLMQVEDLTAAEAFKKLGPSPEGANNSLLRGGVSDNGGNKIMSNENNQPKTNQPEAADDDTTTYSTYEDLLINFKNWNRDGLITEYKYSDPNKLEDFNLVILRTDKNGVKKFKQASKNAQGLWWYKSLTGATPLYNRRRVDAAHTIVVVEGEKCVNAVTELGIEGFAATTTPMGSGSGDKGDWRAVAGKRVVIFRDNDEQGEAYQRKVIEKLVALDPPVLLSIVNVKELGLAEKEDVVDYLASVEGTIEEKRAALLNIISTAKNLSLTDAISERYKDIISGKFKTLKFPGMPSLSNLTQALLPGTVTLLCGDPGAGKTFFILQSMWKWIIEDNLKVRVLMLEEDLPFYQTRLTAQMCGTAGLANNDFIKANAELATDKLNSILPNLERVSKAITCSGAEAITLDKVADWIIQQVENNADIIIVDPVTLAKGEGKPWDVDQAFLIKVKAVVERKGARLIISTHPRTGKAGTIGMAGLAGGAAYPRASQTILWLQNLEELRTANVTKMGTVTQGTHRQILNVLKCRNGKGLGAKFALNLNHETLGFDDIGLIVPEQGEGDVPTYDSYDGAPKAPVHVPSDRIALGD